MTPLILAPGPCINATGNKGTHIMTKSEPRAVVCNWKKQLETNRVNLSEKIDDGKVEP
jgi:hypothetical protein